LTGERTLDTHPVSTTQPSLPMLVRQLPTRAYIYSTTNGSHVSQFRLSWPIHQLLPPQRTVDVSERAHSMWGRGRNREFLSPRNFRNSHWVLHSCVSDPLVHHGRHFGRTLHAMTNVQVLLTNGILRMGELSEEPEDVFTAEYISSALVLTDCRHTDERSAGKGGSIESSQNCFKWCQGLRSA
jgi:hypothetical protein